MDLVKNYVLHSGQILIIVNFVNFNPLEAFAAMFLKLRIMETAFLKEVYE